LLNSTYFERMDASSDVHENIRLKSAINFRSDCLRSWFWCLEIPI